MTQSVSHDIIRILLEERDGQLMVTVRESPFGETYEQPNPMFAKLLQDPEFAARRALLGDGRATHNDLKTLGQQMFSLLIPEAYREWWKRIKRLSREKALALFLYINTNRLAALPWETAFDPEMRTFLSLNRHFALMRLADSPSLTAVDPIERKSHIVAAFASPAGLGALDVVLEEALLRKAVAIPLRQDAMSLDIVPTATRTALQAALERGPVNLVHIGAHAAEANGAPAVMLEDENGQSDPLPAADLAVMLKKADVRLAVLMVERSAGDALREDRALIQALVEQGVPAAIGLQNKTPEQAVLSFLKGFYQGLADGSAVAQALADARLNMNVEAGEEGAGFWHAPVLLAADRTVLQPLIPSRHKKTAEMSATFARASQDAVSGRGGAVIGGSQMYQEAEERIQFRGLVSGSETLEAGTLSPGAGSTLESGFPASGSDPAVLNRALDRLKQAIFAAPLVDTQAQVRAITAYEQIDYEVNRQTINMQAVRGYLSEIDRLLPDAAPQTNAIRNLINS